VLLKLSSRFQNENSGDVDVDTVEISDSLVPPPDICHRESDMLDCNTVSDDVDKNIHPN